MASLYLSRTLAVLQADYAKIAHKMSIVVSPPYNAQYICSKPVFCLGKWHILAKLTVVKG